MGILPGGRHRKILEVQVLAEGSGYPEPWVERWVTQVTHLRPGPSNKATPALSAFPPDSLGSFGHIFPI